ncbi:histone deacetylase complex subunit SAP25 [Pteropus medius]|uniref:histone deacetylase complex subunit SAP25 n=1 Tax=Pteropus vampyrus TaxID=132908 RepID=UPI00196A8523|nr:histone deacetylase complex subunit SAP25 [Pteropus giganteus]
MGTEVLPCLPPRRGMLPGPSRWGAGEEQEPEEQGPLAGSDPSEAWTSGEEALGEPGTPPQDSPQPQSPRPSWTRKEHLLTPSPSGLVAEQSSGTSVPLSPQVAWELAPSRVTLLAPWDPNYEAKAGPGLLWGPSCGSGASFSGRTLGHPSFWPLYEAASGRGHRPLAPTIGHQNGKQVPRDAGFPVMCCEDVFLSDPLLPCGQRVPLYLSEAPQQVMGSPKLLLPPPIMSPRVCPTQSPGCSTAWLSGPELIALTGLLQMSQGEPRPSFSGSSMAPTPFAGPPEPISNHPGPSGDPSCPHCTDPSLPWTPDTHCP